MGIFMSRHRRYFYKIVLGRIMGTSMDFMRFYLIGEEAERR